MTSPSPAGKTQSANTHTHVTAATFSTRAAAPLKVEGEDARGPCVHIKGASEPAWVLQHLDRSGPVWTGSSWTGPIQNSRFSFRNFVGFKLNASSDTQTSACLAVSLA